MKQLHLDSWLLTLKMLLPEAMLMGLMPVTKRFPEKGSCQFEAKLGSTKKNWLYKTDERSAKGKIAQVGRIRVRIPISPKNFFCISNLS